MIARTATLMIAHGSRRAASNEEFLKIVAQMQARYPQQKFFAAFLEIATPDIPTGIDQVIAQGFEDLKIFPFYLNQGTHVQTDIPEIVAAKRIQYPQAKIEILPYLGARPDFVDWLASAVLKSPQ